MESKITDRRVDSMLVNNKVFDARIFCSPITSWLSFFLLMIVYLGGYFYPALGIWWVQLMVIVYTCVSYLVNARLNNSFAVRDEALIVVNTNIPCRKILFFKKEDIKQITILEDKRAWREYLLATGSNCVWIDTGDHLYRFYCISLELEGWDDPWNVETIDSFRHCLTERGYPVVWKID